MKKLRFTVLGSGSSGGVPRLGGIWGDCDPNNPKNRRRRCSLLVEKIHDKATTTILIDTSPDLRDQLLDANVKRLDGVFYTHYHADHIHGIDDLRVVVFNMKERLNVFADKQTKDSLLDRFNYVFNKPETSPYPPILTMNDLNDSTEIDGPGGSLIIEPFKVNHGSIDSLGFRIENFAYLPDVFDLYDESRKALQDLDYLIIDALRRTPHPSHTHLDKTLKWIEELKPNNAILTNMHIDMDYETLCKETAKNIQPAFDGMTIELDY